MTGELAVPGEPPPTEPWEIYSQALRLRLARFWTAPHPVRAGIVPAFHERGPARRIAGSPLDFGMKGLVNPYWDIIRELPCEYDPKAFIFYGNGPAPMTYVFPPEGGVTVFADRHELCPLFSWSIPHAADLAWIGNLLQGRGLVEVGAGTGYWVWLLRQLGIDAIGYDKSPGANPWAWHTWTDIRKGGPEKAAAHPGRALFLCWPPYATPMAAKALTAYKGDLLFYAGEPEGGEAADDDFFKILHKEWEEISESPYHLSYWGIHCHLTAWRRTP